MAFVSRAPRVTGENYAGRRMPTNEGVGPGSYISHNAYDDDISYAPFSSTTERGLHDAVSSNQYTPGPGAYKTPKGTGADPPKEVSTCNFVSNVAKFAKDKSSSAASPGPGAYDDKNKWIKNTHRYKLEPQARRVTFQRMPTAPSVPARHQSYGYEESETGELVLQKPPEVGHTGIGADTAGPAGYNPTFSQLHSDKKTDFKMSKSKRGIFDMNSNPGPGQYKPRRAGANILQDIAEQQYMTPEEEAARPPVQPTSNFASKVPLQAQVKPSEEKAVPGPGTYGHKTQFKTREVPETQQFFLSTCRRAYEVDVPSQLAAATYETTPGPGKYNEMRSSFKPQRLGPDASPFHSTARRFTMDKGLVAVPGPGAYDEANNINFVSDMNKKVVSRNGVFGSTSERFADAKSKDSYLFLSGSSGPGPGTYSDEPDEGATLARLRRKETSQFASTSERFNKTAPPAVGSDGMGEEMDEDKPQTSRVAVPPPGAYEVEDLWRNKRNPQRRSEAFISKESRFTSAKDTSKKSPGPGTYENSRLRNPIAVNRSCFVSGSNRFNESKSVAPGPGMYETEDPNASMVKRSFNVTIDGVMW